MKNKNIIILGLAGFIVMADNWVVSPILPSIAQSIGIPVTSAGLLITAYMIPFGLFQLIFGPLSDRFGKNAAIFAFTFATGLTALGHNLVELGFLRALTGIFAASVMPVSMALIADIVSPSERQSAIGMFMGISFLGQGMSMAIGGSIAFLFNWRGVFVIYSILAAIITFLFLTVGHRIPSIKNRESEVFTPYLRLLKKQLKPGPLSGGHIGRVIYSRLLFVYGRVYC